MRSLFLAACLILTTALGALAQDTQESSTDPAAAGGSIQSILVEHGDVIAKSSRKTIGPAIDAIAASGLSQAQAVLQAWQAKEMWRRTSDGLFFWGEKIDSKTYRLTDFDTGEDLGPTPKSELKQIKPNSGIRALLGTALVQFQLLDPDPVRRGEALTAIERDPDPALLAPLRASIEAETDPDLLARKTRSERLLTMAFDPDSAARVAAIEEMSSGLGLDVRAALNPLVATTLVYAPAADLNISHKIKPGDEALSIEAAYAMMVAAGDAPELPDADARKDAIIAAIENDAVAGIAVADLNTQEARDRAYLALNPDWDPTISKADTVAGAQFAAVYTEPDAAVTTAAEAALKDIATRVGISQTVDLTLDALSLASIYFLAAIGLAITFGVMGVINMAHGEFIMMGAYTGYVVQQIIPNHTLSIIAAVPLAFAVTFAAGVAMERLVIRWLYNRPLETLLATFGISIALQQLAKNIFGTQARPLTSPGWLDGAWAFNDVISISYIRIAIFVLALIFLGFFLFLMNRTRLGLETRAVTQNRAMAGAMGINPDRVNMLTFGLGSGIAGIAGVAIGLFAKVTSELGSDYIVQSFMTVVVGGVGNIWGTLAGATMIGFLQKGIEWMNPSNTLAAQTYMIVFIIIFIQFRPRGIIALKGRAAGD